MITTPPLSCLCDATRCETQFWTPSANEDTSWGESGREGVMYALHSEKLLA